MLITISRQELDRYDVIFSKGGYPITVERPAEPLTDTVQMELRRRHENAARRQRELRQRTARGLV